MNSHTPEFNSELSLAEMKEIRLHLLEEYQNRKDFLDVDLNELETFFSQRPCVTCQTFFLLRMNLVIGLIQEMVQFQSEIHKDEHH